MNYLFSAKIYSVFMAAMLFSKLGEMPKVITEPYGIDLLFGFFIAIVVPCWLFYMAGKSQ